MFELMKQKKQRMVLPEEALAGREEPIVLVEPHFVLGSSMLPPFPSGTQQAVFGLGCFWGAEKIFWQLAGVHTTAVGYAAGFTKNPSYEEVCTGKTGHNEVVLVVFDPEQISYQQLLQVFWEGHNPAQFMQQGNDVGTQYRSGIYTFSEEQQAEAEASRNRYDQQMQESVESRW